MILNSLLFFLIIVLLFNKSTIGIHKNSDSYFKNEIINYLVNKFNNSNNNNNNNNLKRQLVSANNCQGQLTLVEYTSLWSFANDTKIKNSHCYNQTNNYPSRPWHFNGTNYEAPCTWNTYINCSTLINNSNYCTITNLVINNCLLNGTITSAIGNLSSLESFEITEAASDTTIFRINFFYDIFKKAVNHFLNNTQDSEVVENFLELLHYKRQDSFGLHGSIPSELGLLSNLKILTFINLRIDGSLPSSVGNLINLQQLKIESTLLHGSIPDELYSLKQLTLLHIGANIMNGSISNQIGGLKNLSSLLVYLTLMTGSIPSSISSLRSLTELEFFSLPRFTCNIPSDINKLEYLESLYIGNFFGPDLLKSNITFCHFPDIYMPNLETFVVGGGFWYGRLPFIILPKIKFFYLGLGFWEDSLDRLLESLGKNKTVEGLGLGFLPCIHGQISSSIGKLLNVESILFTHFPNQEAQKNVKYLLQFTNQSSQFQKKSFCSRTLYGQLPTEMKNLTKIKFFYFTNTPLNGSVLDLVVQWPSLKSLLLYSNSFSSTLPPEICSLTDLTSFAIPSNSFSGPLPSCFWKELDLTSLLLSSNRFSGSLPETSNLSSLRDLFIDYNLISGSIPQTFLNSMTSLEYLAISSNSFSPSNVPDLSNLTKIIYIEMNKCNLNGPLPEIEKKKYLKQFSASDNQLSSTIPSSFSSNRKLLVLSLYNNSLTGVLPVSLGTLENLQVLYLDDNQFIGNVSWLSYCTKLSLISLGSNKFSGPLPLFKSTQMLSIHLENNYFTSTIPITYSSMSSLVILSLASNKLHGKINDIFKSMTYLRQIHFQNNMFTSTLPDSLTNCTNLVTFDISNNSITGSLPNFSKLKRLTYFIVARNKMTGTIPRSLLINAENSSAAKITGIDLSSNSFTGHMSDFLASDLNLANLEWLNINNNFFSGPVSIPIVDNSTLQNLQTLVLTQNCFTSIINTDALCSAQNISLLHMGVLYRTKGKAKESCKKKYYFEFPYDFGNINKLTCLFESGRNLDTLILTGLGLEGQMPRFFSNSSIRTLLLNFNKLTGTLPAEYQSFGKFKIFSINENKINGTLMSSFAMGQLGGSINMSVNRLSGPVPDQLRELNNNFTIDIVQGNIFSCPLLKSDVNFYSDTCGSSEIYKPSILYLVSLLFTFCLLWYMFYRKTSKLSVLLKGQIYEWWAFANVYLNPSLCTYKKNLLQEKGSSIAVRQDYKIYNTKLMLDFLERTFSTCFCLCFVYLVAMLSYIIMKTGPRQGAFSLFSHQYLYTATNVYLQSTSSATMMAIYLFISGFVSLLMLSLVKPLSKPNQDSESKQQDSNHDKSESYQRHTQSYRIFSIVYTQIINLIISGVGNGLYVFALMVSTIGSSVFIVYHKRVEFNLLITFLQGFIALFRLINISVLIPYFVHKLPTSQGVKQVNHVLMNLMDVIIIPSIAIIFINSSCTNFALAYFNKLDIVLNFDIHVSTITCQPRSILDDNPLYLNSLSKLFAREYSVIQYIRENAKVEALAGDLESYANTKYLPKYCSSSLSSQNLLTQNAPPFYYSFQCSSSMISSFLSVFIYIYSMLCTLAPVVKLKVMLLSTNGYLGYIQKRVPGAVSKFLGSYLFSLNEDTLIDSFRVTDVDVNRIAENNEMEDRMSSYWWNKSIRFAGNSVVSQMCTHITVMLTFGLSSPTLGFMICIFIYFDIMIWRLSLGRYMKIISSDSKTYDINLKILENSCTDSYKCLSRSWWIIHIIVGLYWGFMIFDIVGAENANVISGINGSLVLFFLYTSIFIIANKFLGNEKKVSNVIVRILRNIAFYVHSFIWTNMLKIGSMRSIDCQEVSTSSSITTEHPSFHDISIQNENETFSPFSNSNM